MFLKYNNLRMFLFPGKTATLHCIGTSQPVCKFNQTGFCKYGENGTKMHVNKLCSTLNCNKHISKNRHPKQCKYFLLSERCRFNNDKK